MAMSDYVTRGIGGITPSGNLVFAVNEGDLNIFFGDYVAPDNSIPRVSEGLMMNGEIMRVVNVDAWPNVQVARGCADTIPKKHLPGAKIWVFTMAAGTDDREYLPVETIGIKILMRSTAQSTPISKSPPRELTFNHRFARPYPPGNVQVDGDRYYEVPVSPIPLTADVLLEWSHRDRVGQADQLIGHLIGDIGPEAGTTYGIEICAADGTMIRFIETDGVNYTYPLSLATIDLGFAGGEGFFKLYSLRDGYESWQAYKIPFTVPPITYGWGVDWGDDFGSP